MKLKAIIGSPHLRRCVASNLFFQSMKYSESKTMLNARKTILDKNQNRSSKDIRIEISKPICLVDEEVVVKVTGLEPREGITLLVTTEQDKVKFWSYGVFQATQDGIVDCSTHKPLRGSYTDVDPMGLFWSIAAVPGESRNQRLYTTKATGKRRYSLSVFPEQKDPTDCLKYDSWCMATTEHYRGYKSETVKRIPVKHERLQGTVFIPEGQGPFPAVIDMFGGLVYQFESRAALLASYGFVTLSLAYLHSNNLPDSLWGIEMNYFEEAVDWLVSHEYVKKDGIGVLGLCLGGTMAMWMAENIPKVRAVVNLNGMPFSFCTWTHNGEQLNEHGASIDLDKAYTTEEGLVIRDLFLAEPQAYLKSWRHGAKILVCYSGDDLMTPIQYHMKWYESIPEKYKCNVNFKFYPGAGHLIEPPYMPSIRAIDARKRSPTSGICPEKYFDEPMVVGGYPKEHAAAQKDSWTRVIKFLKENLMHNRIPESNL